MRKQYDDFTQLKMKDNFYLYDKQKLTKYLNENIFNNLELQEFVKKHNEELEVDSKHRVLKGYGAVFNREEFVLMLQLGVPIGVVECINSEGSLLIDEFDEPIEDIHFVYKPINSVDEYVKYLRTDPFPDVKVNPNYMTDQEVRNLAYCLRHSTNDAIFDFNTMSNLQFEIIKSVPLKYKELMKIFNKYFDKSIQEKFIYDIGVDRKRFYYLSGLKELIPPTKNQKKEERNR